MDQAHNTQKELIEVTMRIGFVYQQHGVEVWGQISAEKNLGRNDPCIKCANINIHLATNKIVTFLPMYMVLE